MRECNARRDRPAVARPSEDRSPDRGRCRAALVHERVEAGLKAGASYDEIVGVLVAVIPIVGVARVVSAAPNLALALGYDVPDALELVDG